MPADEPGSKSACDLGNFVGQFMPPKAILAAALIVSIMLIAGGGASIVVSLRTAYLRNWQLPFSAETGFSWLAMAGCIALGIGLIVGGVLLAKFIRKLSSRGLILCENGFCYVARGIVDNVLWSEVARLRETVRYNEPSILTGPLHIFMPRSGVSRYTMILRSGKEYAFDGDSVQRIKQLGKLLRDEAFRCSIPYEAVQERN